MAELQITDPQWREAYLIIQRTTIPGYEQATEELMRDALQAHLWLTANRRHWSQLPASMGERATLSPIVTALQNAGILSQLTTLMRTLPQEEKDTPPSGEADDNPPVEVAVEGTVQPEPEAPSAEPAETETSIEPEPARPSRDDRTDHAREAYPTPPPFPKTDLHVIRALEEWVAYFHHNLYEKNPDTNEMSHLSNFYRVLDMMYAAAEAEIGPVQRRIFPAFPAGEVMERAQLDDAIHYTLTWMQSDIDDFAKQVRMISNLLNHHQFPDPTQPPRAPTTTSDLARLHMEPITERDLETHARRWAKQHDSGVVPQQLVDRLCRTNYPDVNASDLQSQLERVLEQSAFFGDPNRGVYPLLLTTRHVAVPDQAPTPPTRRPDAASRPATKPQTKRNEPSAEEILPAAIAWANAHDGNVTMPDFSVHLRGTKFPTSSLRSLGQRTARMLDNDPRFTRQAPGHFKLTGSV